MGKTREQQRAALKKKKADNEQRRQAHEHARLTSPKERAPKYKEEIKDATERHRDANRRWYLKRTSSMSATERAAAKERNRIATRKWLASMSATERAAAKERNRIATRRWYMMLSTGGKREKSETAKKRYREFTLALKRQLNAKRRRERILRVFARQPTETHRKFNQTCDRAFTSMKSTTLGIDSPLPNAKLLAVVRDSGSNFGNVRATILKRSPFRLRHNLPNRRSDNKDVAGDQTARLYKEKSLVARIGRHFDCMLWLAENGRGVKVNLILPTALVTASVCSRLDVPIRGRVFIRVYREVSQLVANADQVRQLVLEESRVNLRDFLTSVTREVPALPTETAAQYEVRRIGGYRYHLRSAATLQEMLDHAYYPMVDVMPIIHDLFWGRRTAEDAEVQVELAQSRLKSGLHRAESDGWLQELALGLLCSLVNRLDEESETEIEIDEERFAEIERVLAMFTTFPAAFLAQPPIMPRLPSAFTGQDFWVQIPRLRSPSANIFAVGRERNSAFPLEYEAISRLSYPSIVETAQSGREGWLNDRSIDAYMELMERDLARRHSTSIRCYYLHQTQTIGRLQRESDMERSPHRHPFHINSVAPQEFKWLLFPVNVQEDHFIMIAFNSSTSTLTVMDSLYREGDHRAASKICIARIRQYLHWQIRKQQPDFAETQIFVEWLERAIPQQGNDRDCGIYALLFGLYAVLGLPMTFSVCHMDYFRRKLAWDLLSGHIHLAIEHINTGVIGSGDAPAVEHSDRDSVIELTSAMDVLQLDEADLVENVRQDLQLNDYEMVPITEDQRQVVEATAGRVTHVRLCTSECPSATTSSSWATTLSAKIRQFLPLRDKWDEMKDSGHLASLCDAFEECVEECTEGTNYCEDLSKCTHGLNIINKLCRCYSGLRSLRTRYSNLLRNAVWLYLHEKAVELADVDALFYLSLASTLSKKVRYELAALKRATSASVHEERNVLAKYGNLLANCQDEMAQIRDRTCGTCNLLIYPKHMKQVSLGTILENCPSAIPPSLTGLEADRMVDVCYTCLNAIKSNGRKRRAALRQNLTFADRVPPHALTNKLEVTDTPPQLVSLNYIEDLLIKRVRPLQAIVILKPLAWESGGTLKGAKGGVLYMPVPLETTLNYTLDTLRAVSMPNAANMVIVVKSASRAGDVSRTSVDMEKVVHALQWLRNYNPLFADLIIDRNFELEVTNVVDPKMANRVNEEEEDALVVTDPAGNASADYSLLLHEYGMTEVEAPRREGTPYQHFKLVDMRGRPVGFAERSLEYLSFPTLFPTGTNGMYIDTTREVDRPTRLPPNVYIHNRMLNANRRFANNPQYMFHLANWQDMTALSSSVVYQLKKTTKKQGKERQMWLFGVGDITRAIIEKDPQLDEHFSSYFPNVRGHRDYWRQRMLDVRAMCQYFGPPTFFITLNPAEWEWSDLHRLYSNVYEEEVNGGNISKFIARDPVLFADYFTHRIKCVMKTVIQASAMPLGGLASDYWYRKEWQVRGATHTHMLLWVSGAPVVGKNSEEEIIRFIEENITCRLPDPVNEPTLHRLVTQFQQHKCTASCKRKLRTKEGKITGTACRFIFPRPESKITQLNAGSVAVGREARVYLKNYVLTRKKNERFINDYNPLLLLALRANMDIQFISSIDKVLEAYTVGYTAKGEFANAVQEVRTLLEGLDFSNIDRRTLWKYGTLLLRARQLGLVEAAHRLLSLALYDCSVNIEFLNTNPIDQRVKTLLPKKDLEKLEENAPIKNLFTLNFIDDYYPNRPPALENFCLFNIYSNFVYAKSAKRLGAKARAEAEIEAETVSEDANDSGDEESVLDTGMNDIFGRHGYHSADKASPFYKHRLPSSKRAYKLQRDLGYLRLKNVQNLIRLFWPNYELDNAEAVEDWYRRLCLLYIPFRQEEQLMGHYESYYARFEAFRDAMKERSEGAFLDLHRYLETIVRELLEREEERERKRQKTREVKALLDAEEPDDQLEANPRRERVTIEEAVVLQDNLKDDQRWFYKLITEAIEGQAQRELAPQNPDAICEFLTGVGGTGKSALIAAIRAWLNCRFESNRSVCVVSAPTGIAAKNIHGYTLHSVLSFEVQQGGIGQYLPLIDRKRSTLSSQMKEVRLLIVDECSMVSNVMLLKLHRRLCEIGDRGEGSPLQVTASQLSDAAWSSILRPSYSGHLFV